VNQSLNTRYVLLTTNYSSRTDCGSPHDAAGLPTTHCPMNQNIFRSYDIRGIYPSELDENTAKKIGKAYTSYLIKKLKVKSPKVIVGKDNRPHGVSLQAAFIEGCLEHGATVDKVEDCASPMLYHAICEGDYDGGVNITASHNPAEYNGIKLQGRGAHSIAGDEIQVIKQMILAEDYEAASDDGRQKNVEIHEAYIEKTSSLVQLKKPLKIIIDAANGITGKYYPEVFRKLGCEVIELYCEQDGTFPNHEADPVKEKNTEGLKKAVLENNADLGISFDGDGDRCAIIDEQGVYHDANQSMVLLAEDILSRHPGTPVVFTVSNSLIVAEAIRNAGGKPLMVPVGHSYVEHAMTEHKALFGGEQSGHFFISENYYSYDDAAYAAAKLLEIFSSSEKKVSGIYFGIEETVTAPEFRISCPDEEKFQIVEKITQALSEKYEVNKMDGVRVEFANSAWLGIRASNTSPKLSVIIEAKTEEEFVKIAQIGEDLMNTHGLSLRS
jgi:phosphomannomutase/phosphoglucomutase